MFTTIIPDNQFSGQAQRLQIGRLRARSHRYLHRAPELMQRLAVRQCEKQLVLRGIVTEARVGADAGKADLVGEDVVDGLAGLTRGLEQGAVEASCVFE